MLAGARIGATHLGLLHQDLLGVGAERLDRALDGPGERHPAPQWKRDVEAEAPAMNVKTVCDLIGTVFSGLCIEANLAADPSRNRHTISAFMQMLRGPDGARPSGRGGSRVDCDGRMTAGAPDHKSE